MLKPQITHFRRSPASGQALVEYALILVLLAVALAFAVAFTGPAIGNVFCNVVDNLAGEESADVCGRGAADLAVVGGAPNLFWETVTWVAQNPQAETPYPTPVSQPPTVDTGGFDTNTPSPTPTLTNTPTNTPSPTTTLTPSVTWTPTIGASATPSDLAFTVPHVDQISNPQWWRLDGANYWLGGSGETWSAQYYDGANSTSINNANLTTLPSLSNPRNLVTYSFSDIAFDWGTGRPSEAGLGGNDTWGAVFTRTITLAEAVEVTFSLSANDYLRLAVNGTPVTFAKGAPGTATHTMTLPAGSNTFTLNYAENSSNASFSFSARRTRVNPDDSASNCPWGQVSNTQNSNSAPFQFENTATGSWTANATCYLELRGYIDLASVANPVLTLWDIWDFSGGGVTAQLQYAEYVTDVSGQFDRAAATWTSVNLAGSFTSNYNWTRHEIPLAGAGGTSQKVTLRFRLTSTGATPFRWHIDDLRVTDEPATAGYFTVRDRWDLNTRAQMDEFIFNDDTNRTLELNPTLPQTQQNPYRWDLTGTRKRGTSGFAWDQSPGGNYVTHNQGGDRIYSLEFARQINLAAAPTDDLELDTGDPLLSFWFSYDLPDGAALRVEYTTDARDATPDTWTTIPDEGVIVGFTAPAGTPGQNELAPRSNATMQFVDVNLSGIPATAFRLRFALAVQTSAATTGDGVYIDDIQIERESTSPYFAYPFYDDAESATNLASYWLNLGDSWGQTSESPNVGNSDTQARITPGALGTSFTYSDSPNATYTQNTVVSLELKRAIDLLRDSPDNTEAVRPAAVEPQLTFWHHRDVGNNVQLTVEMWTPASAAWTQIWIYNSATHATNLRRQDAWERIEINLRRALETIEGANWAAIAANGDGVTNDDDIKIRFNFDTDGATDDGVYIDEINISDANFVAYEVWPTASGGDGPFIDNIESVVGTDLGLTNWFNRWVAGGIWTASGVQKRNGSLALDVAEHIGSVDANYIRNAEQFIELVPIIDLTSTPVTDPIYLNFWMRYDIASSHFIRVSVAQEVPAESPASQFYGKVAGWAAWADVPVTIDGVNNSTGITGDYRVDTWGRAQVDLTAYRGSRVRLRFSVEAPSGGGDRNIYIDQVSVTHGVRTISLPFQDTASSTNNWTLEHNWALTEQYFQGTGSAADDLGGGQWRGFFYDCEALAPAMSCTSTSTYTHLMDTAYPNPPSGDCSAPVSLVPSAPVGPDCRPAIEYYLYDPQTPMNGSAPTDFQNTFAARFTRTVTLQPGATYRVQMVSDDGVRLFIDNRTGTDIPAYSGSEGVLVNNWGDHGPTADFDTFTVTSVTPITRTLILEYYENGGGAVLDISVGRFNYSFTDSPNTLAGSTWTTVASPLRGDTAMILNGIFNFTGRPTPRLFFDTLHDMGSLQSVIVESSIDGGMTWVNRYTIGANSFRGLTDGWQEHNVDLSGVGNQASVTLRFRVDTRTATTSGAGEADDGVFISNIRVN